MSDPAYYPPAPNYPPPQPHPWGPFTAGELLRRTFQLYREHFAAFFGISAVATALSLVVQLPMQIVPFALGMRQPAPDPAMIFARLGIFFTLAILSTLIGMYIYALTYGAMFWAVADIRQSGTATVTRALEQTAPRSLRLLGAYLLAGLRIIAWVFLFCLVFGIIGGFIALAFHAGGLNLSALHGGPGGRPDFSALGAAFVTFILLILVAAVIYLFFALWLYGRYLLFIPAALAENIGANTAVNRSVELSRGSKGRIYSLLIVCFVLSMVSIAAAAPFLFLAVRSGHQVGPAAVIISMAEVMVIAIAQTLLMHPVYGIGIALCYFDLRARKDSAPVAPPPLPAAAPAWQPPVAETPVTPAPAWEPPPPVEPSPTAPEPQPPPDPEPLP